MTELERFELVLEELSQLLLELHKIGLADDAVLIGAQVVALEQRNRDAPAFRLALPSGIEVPRPFSLEPDLVFDTDEFHRLEGLPDALKAAGFMPGHTPGRPSRWTKVRDGVSIEIDLFTTADCEENDIRLPTRMTRLRGAPQFRCREVRLTDQSRIKVPDAHAYLSMKLEAKLRIRPGHHKDSLDLFAYAHVVGADEINAALARAGADGERVRGELRQLFEHPNSPGVQDVWRGAGQGMHETEAELLVRAVLDTFVPIIAPQSPVEPPWQEEQEVM